MSGIEPASKPGYGLAAVLPRRTPLRAGAPLPREPRTRALPTASNRFSALDIYASAPAARAHIVARARRANTDPVLYYQTQDKWIREYWVHIEYMKMLKDEVRNCYRREGVNHYENCRDLVHEYYARTKAPSTRTRRPRRPGLAAVVCCACARPPALRAAYVLYRERRGLVQFSWLFA
jgi:hypothetical protein